MVRSSKIDNYYRFLLLFRTTVRVQHLYVEANFLVAVAIIHPTSGDFSSASKRAHTFTTTKICLNHKHRELQLRNVQHASLHLAMDGHYLHVTTVKNFFLQKSASDKLVKVTKNILRCVNAVSRRERMLEREKEHEQPAQ